MEAEKVEDREKLISDIKNEIADIIKVINNDAVIVSDNHGLDQQMQKLKEIVEKIGDEVLMGEFETAEGIYKKKKEKEEKERSNNTQEINELSTAFEDFRVHMEGFKNMHSFDNVKENIKTKDLLEKMLLDIKAKIEKLPKDSDHRRYYESRYQKEKTFYKNRVIGFEVIEAVNNKMNSLHTNICGLPSDASKFTNAQLVEQFGPVKGMIASVRKDLPMINASLRAEIEETLSRYEEQFKEKESKVEPKLVESDKESEKLYNDKLNRIKELEEGLNESNYLVSKKEYDIITREFKGIPFYNREIEKNLTKLRDKVGKSFTSKLKIIEASATKESSVGNTPEHEIVSQCIDSSVKQIEDEIRKLNAKDFVEGDVEQIKNMISELENWNFDIRGVQIIKVDSKDFDGLKQQVTERVSSLIKSLKEQI